MPEKQQKKQRASQTMTAAQSALLALTATALFGAPLSLPKDVDFAEVLRAARAQTLVGVASKGFAALPDGAVPAKVMREWQIETLAIIRKNAALLAALEALVHPAVIRDFEAWKERQEGGLVVIESAILLEKPRFAGLMDYTLAVTAPEEVRIARVMARDGISADQVRRRMAAQWSDEARLAHADFVLENDDRQALLPAVLQIIDKIKRRWKRQI